MKGLQIFTHSVRQVLGNLVPALQVSAVLYAVQFLITTFLGRPGSGANAVLGILGTIVIVIVSLWIAVGWYRYILLNEQPSIVPQFHPDRLIAVLIKMVIIIVILIIPAIAMVFIMAPVSQSLITSGFAVLMLVNAVLISPIVLLFLLFSPAIAGTAIGKEGGLNAAFNATKGDLVNIFVVALILVLLQAAVGILSVYVFSKIPLGMMVWGVVSGWFVTMVGISTVATLYGHYVEKRALT